MMFSRCARNSLDKKQHIIIPSNTLDAQVEFELGSLNSSMDAS